MDLPGTDEFRWNGLVVSAIGFVGSRATVAASVTMTETLPEFLLTTALPMVVGFGLVVFGLGLTVSSLDPAYVRTVATWCLLGTVGMLATVLVAAVDTGMLLEMEGVVGATAGSYATNTVLGGATGGTLIGVYAARAARQRLDLASRTDRLHLLNRLLRDEVLNAITVVLGRADAVESADDPADHARTIRRNAEHVQSVIDDVGDLTDDSDAVLGEVRADSVVGAVVDDLRERYPEATLTLDAEPASVRADDQLSMLVEQIVENAVEHGGERPRVGVGVARTDTAVEIAVTDDGPGLGEEERALLASGNLDRYDRPSEGFGLWIARLLLDRYGGTAGVTVEGGTTVTLRLPRADGRARTRDRSGLTVRPRRLRNAVVAGLVAGVGMGVTLQVFSNVLPVIGALYGTPSAAVGWVTHLFHSVVFAVVFATVLSHPRLAGVADRVTPTTGLSVVFGTGLWLVAAGLVMPVWLRLVGIDVPLPRLRFVPLVGHLLWAALLGLTYWALERTPELERDG